MHAERRKNAMQCKGCRWVMEEGQSTGCAVCQASVVAVGSGTAESKRLKVKMLWMCMRWRARNAKEVILAVHYRGCYLRQCELRRVVGVEDITLSDARSGVRFPKYAMSGKQKAEVGVMSTEE